MRRHATGMTAPRMPFEDTQLLWSLAGLPGWRDDDSLPGYPGTGHDHDLALDLRAAPGSTAGAGVRLGPDEWWLDRERTI